MSLLSGDVQLGDFDVVLGERAGWIEATSAVIDEARATSNFNSDKVAGGIVVQRLFDQVREETGQDPEAFGLADPFELSALDLTLRAAKTGRIGANLVTERNNAISDLEVQLWALAQNEGATRDTFSPELRDRFQGFNLRSERAAYRAEVAGDAATTLERASGFTRLTAPLSGGVAAAFTDPLQIATGFTPVGSSRTILAAGVKEAAVSLGVETLIQPVIASNYAEAGLDYTALDAGINLAAAAIFGGALGGAGKAAEFALLGRPEVREARQKLEQLPDDDPLRLASRGSRKDVVEAAKRLDERLADDGVRLARDLEDIAVRAEVEARPADIDIRDHVEMLDAATRAAIQPESAPLPRAPGPVRDQGDADLLQFRQGEADAGPVQALAREEGFEVSGVYSDRTVRIFSPDQRLVETVSIDDINPDELRSRLRAFEVDEDRAAQIAEKRSALGDYIARERDRPARVPPAPQGLSELASERVQAGEIEPELAREIARHAPDPATHSDLIDRLIEAKPSSPQEARAIIGAELEARQARSADRVFTPAAAEVEIDQVADVLEGQIARDLGEDVSAEPSNVAGDIRSQLVEKEIYAPAEADVQAQAFAAMVETLASRTGTSADALMKTYGPAIEKGVPDNTGFALPQGAVEIPSSEGLIAIRSDALGFTTTAERALFDPAPRFRDARNLTKDQWRNYFRDAGATREAFQFQIEPALETLPSKGDITKSDVIKAVRASRPKTTANTKHVNDPGADQTVEYETDYSSYVSPGKFDGYRQELIIMPEAAAGYRSHNWGAEGVIGHIRTTERVTIAGEAVRFVDELQSDLHQEGAQFGYKGDAETSQNLAAQMRKAGEQMRSARRRLAEYEAQQWENSRRGDLEQAPAPDFESDPTWIELDREAQIKSDRVNELGSASRTAASDERRRPPRAPVQNWEKPFIRRVIQQSIADGKSLVAFTNFKTLNGALQNEGTQKFYDDRLPAHIRKVASDLGATVERVSLGASVTFDVKRRKVMEFHGRKTRNTTKFDVFEVGRDAEDPRQYVQTFDKRSDAKEYIERQHARNDRDQHVLAIRITQDVKDNLAKGNALFQENRGAFEPRRNAISLFETADPSTFMHESAHWYLDTLLRMDAQKPNKFVTEQLDAIYKWKKVSRETPVYDEAGAPTGIGRELHEAFAETFEKYLQTGKAPSSKLRAAFDAFRDWLTELYLRVDPRRRADLTPEIRGVFDRMMATDREINAHRYLGRRSFRTERETPSPFGNLADTVPDDAGSATRNWRAGIDELDRKIERFEGCVTRPGGNDG